MKQLSKNEIIKLLNSEETINCFMKYNISTALIFGSLNTDNFNIESDVDIAVISDKKIDLDNILDIEFFLQNYLHRDIDVVDLKSENLDIFLKINILNEGKVLYSNDNNNVLEKYKDNIDWIYRENEDFIYFRRRDVLS